MVYYMCAYCLEYIIIGHLNLCLHILHNECIKKNGYEFDKSGFPVIRYIELSHEEYYDLIHKKFKNKNI